MSQPADGVDDSQVVDPHWKTLYIIAGVAALLAVVVFRRNCGTELITFSGFGIFDVPEVHPVTASDWFMFLQDDNTVVGTLVALAVLDAVDLINYLLVGLIFLALYGALHRANKGAMAIATAFALVGIAVHSVSNQAFTMLSLSDQYAAAATDAQRAMFLAAGEARLAVHNPGTPYQGTGITVSLFLVLLAGLIISIIMLRSSVFSKATAYVGILANGLALTHFVVLAFVSSPYVIAIPTAVSAPFRVTWYVLIALGLFRLAKGTPNQGADSTVG